jgi:short-subunit dehydrogenase
MAPSLRHVVVTGAAGAIGGALAERFGARYPGAHVSLVDVDAAALARRASSIRGASQWVWDLSDPARLPDAWSALVETRGQVDALINCAGIMNVQSLVGTPWLAAQRLIDIDMISPLRLMSLAAPGMVTRGSGVIVNVSSMAGRVPLRGCTYYGAAKAGLAMASEIAHLELAGRGVHVVTVYPGPVTSALERGARAQMRPSLVSRLMPVGDPDRVAAMILRAVERREPRVVAPALYAVADRALGVATWITRRFSPPPST